MTDQDWAALGLSLLIVTPLVLLVFALTELHAWRRRRRAERKPKLRVVPTPPYIVRAKMDLHTVLDAPRTEPEAYCACGTVCELRDDLLVTYELCMLVTWATQQGRLEAAETLLDVARVVTAR